MAEADHREQVVWEGKAIMPQIQAMMESFVDDPGMRKNIIPNFGAGVKQMTQSKIARLRQAAIAINLMHAMHCILCSHGIHIMHHAFYFYASS